MEQTMISEQLKGLVVERVKRDSSFTMTTVHLHNEFELYYLYKGYRSYFIEDQVYPIKSGTLVFIAANKIHKTTELMSASDNAFMQSKSIDKSNSNSSHDRILLSLDEKLYQTFQTMANSMNLNHFFLEASGVLALTYQEQNEIEKLLYTISYEITHRQNGCFFLIQSKLTELLLFIMRKYSDLPAKKNIVSNNSTSSSYAEIVSRIASYISENITGDCSLKKISEQFFLSKYYICRIFKASTGLTINEYLNMKKVQKAKFFLETTTYSITKVSELSGYETLTHFERNFMKFIKQSPQQYRKSYKTSN